MTFNETLNTLEFIEPEELLVPVAAWEDDKNEAEQTDEDPAEETETEEEAEEETEESEEAEAGEEPAEEA